MKVKVKMSRPTRYDVADLDQLLKQLKMNWKLRDDKAYMSLQVQAKSFSHAMLLANSVAHFAEQLDHHPDITIKYRTLEFGLSTHDAGGLTELDFKLAKIIEDLSG